MSPHLIRLRSVLKRLKNHQPASALELADYPLVSLPQIPHLNLKAGDRLAICGDSITEQRLYCLMIEVYLTACRPDLQVSVRQYGWSGEKAREFLGRMEEDVLRFHPTIATTLYGMNDFMYVPHDEEIAAAYGYYQSGIIRRFQEAGCAVLLGSPTIIDTVPEWVKSARGSKYDLNLALCHLRNLTIELAVTHRTAFADHFRMMLEADFTAKNRYGPGFKVAGADGVHPDWAGQAIVAFGFLKNMGLDGDMGTVVLDSTTGIAEAPPGHELIHASPQSIRLRSTRLPFCPGPGPENVSDSLRAGMALVPFDDELNRFILRLPSARDAAYHVTWGAVTRRYEGEELRLGVNLAKDFPGNPLVPVFQQIWSAVVNKQAFETRQYKELLQPRGNPGREAAFEMTEQTRGRYLHAIEAACQPVDHEIRVVACD